MIRKIVKIDENKCNGCGICITACHEHAIEMVDGKARLVSDKYCDGLGDCLPGCPMNAIEIIEREAAEYDDDAVKARIAANKAIGEAPSKAQKMPCGCPGTAARALKRTESKANVVKEEPSSCETSASQLQQWPVQLRLMNPEAPYLQGADLLVAADCTAYAHANFHRDFIKGHITVIGCPKLDDIAYYEEKLAEMIRMNNFKSITVVRMSVPCCGGIVSAVKNAMLKTQTIVPYREVVISTEGNVM